MQNRIWMLLATVLVFICVGGTAWAQPTCPAAVRATPKGSRLYLYFPTASDSTFPNYGTSTGTTSPLQPFDVADLDSAIGTTNDLRNRIFDLVTDDYCEFHVEVVQTTTAPSPTEARWQIVGIGTDTAGSLFGEAQAVDTNDSDAQDFARVWARSFLDQYGGAGGALNGTNSTLLRWATAIGETSAHEAGHNYGLAHGNSAPRSGSAEDEQNNHIMATGSTGLTGEIRAGRDRHFSDTEYEILGHNIGLNTKTLHNWDFINPNDTRATRLRLQLLSTASTLTLAWFYTGNSSPWTNPTVTSTGTTRSFQGTTYNVFNLEFSSPKAWSGGANGEVAAGVEFHVGASFTQSEAVIVEGTQLFDGTTELPLSPRMVGFDAGTTDLATGDFALRIFNANPAAGDLLVRDIVVQRLPRMLDINAMVTGERPVDIRGIPVLPTRSTDTRAVSLKDATVLPVAKLTDPRSVDILYGPEDCPPGSIGSGTEPPQPEEGPGDRAVGELLYCHRGNALSLFPATYLYVTATVVEPNARFWDRVQGRFVTGPLESKVFFQLAGFVPDFNSNGTDDLIDIRTGGSPDGNGNGVPDEAEQPGVPARGLRLSVHAGVAISHAPGKVGASVTLDAEYALSRSLSVAGLLGYNALADASGARLNAFNLSVNAKYYAPLGGAWRPFVNVGGGVYLFNPGDIQGGGNVGAGLQYAVSPRVALEGAYNFHHSFGTPAANFSTVQLGALVGW